MPEKIITYVVGYGVTIGVPLLLGIAFAAGLEQPGFLLLPIVPALLVGLCYSFHPTGFSVDAREVGIVRPVGRESIPLERLKAIRLPASHSPGFTIALFVVAGFYGVSGTFWNCTWGRFHVFVSDQKRRVELVLANGSRVIVSPHDPAAFVRAVKAAAEGAGVALDGTGA